MSTCWSSCIKRDFKFFSQLHTQPQYKFTHHNYFIGFAVVVSVVDQLPSDSVDGASQCSYREFYLFLVIFLGVLIIAIIIFM